MKAFPTFTSDLTLILVIWQESSSWKKMKQNLICGHSLIVPIQSLKMETEPGFTLVLKVS